MNGRVFEAVAARLEGRRASALDHCALEVYLADARDVIEMTPVLRAVGVPRGVVAEGVVGVRWAGGARVFCYEVRRWLELR